MSHTPNVTMTSCLPDHRVASYETLIHKTRRNIADLAKQPATWSYDPDGDFANWQEGFFEIGNWTSSFFTGMALIAWNETEDEHFIRKVLELDPLYQKKLAAHAADTMHDLGFLYSLHSVMLHKLTGEACHRELGLKAAETLANRFVPEGNYIRAWGRMDEKGTDWDAMAIIDCMMNLPLLYWATEETGDPRFKDIAIRHSNMTMEKFIRDDDSVFHAYRFDPASGEPLRGENYCGYGLDSHWSRGTAWAIHGFAMGYRYTGDERYLDASLRLSRKFISLLDDEIIPLWDFRLPEELRHNAGDASAAAIVVCGFQELEAAGKADPEITTCKDALLDRLCSPDYFNPDPSIRGGLQGCWAGRNGHAFTSWGDYFLMQALAHENGMTINWW